MQYLRVFYLSAVLALNAPLTASALEFSYSSRFPDEPGSNLVGVARQVTLSGTIESGDTDKFISFLRADLTDAHFALMSIRLESPGGNVIEAMRLALFLKAFYPDIGVSGTCASSCLLLWLSGGVHYPPEEPSRIGIHRPYFDPNRFSKLSLREAESRYAKLADDFKAFVLSQGLPPSIYEKLIATSSKDIYWLTTTDLGLIGVAAPAYDERYKSECGKLEGRPRTKCRNTMLGPERKDALEKLKELSEPPARWIKMGLVGENMTYIDASSLIRTGGIVDGLIVVDHKVAGMTRGESSRSTRSRTQYDCENRKSRMKSFGVYAEQMGKGKLIYSSDKVASLWTDVKPDSSIDPPWKFACNQKNVVVRGSAQ